MLTLLLAAVIVFPKPLAAASGASFPSGATHYWAFQNNLSDGVGSCTLLEGGTAYVAGKNGQGIEVPAGCGSVSSDSCSLPATTAFSIVFWVKTDSGTGSSFSWALGVAGANISSSSEEYIAKVGATGDNITVAHVHDTWELIVVTYDGTSVEKISVNGGTFVTGATTVEGVGGDFTITTSDGSVHFDEMVTWTRALTQEEATALYTPLFGP